MFHRRWPVALLAWSAVAPPLALDGPLSVCRGRGVGPAVARRRPLPLLDARVGGSVGPVDSFAWVMGWVSFFVLPPPRAAVRRHLSLDVRETIRVSQGLSAKGP